MSTVKVENVKVELLEHASSSERGVSMEEIDIDQFLDGFAPPAQQSAVVHIPSSPLEQATSIDRALNLMAFPLAQPAVVPGPTCIPPPLSSTIPVPPVWRTHAPSAVTAASLSTQTPTPIYHPASTVLADPRNCAPPPMFPAARMSPSAAAAQEASARAWPDSPGSVASAASGASFGSFASSSASPPPPASATVFPAPPQGVTRRPRRRRKRTAQVPSRFCHICARTQKSAKICCTNIGSGRCRKAVCELCFVEHGWDFKAAVASGRWQCPHCLGMCDLVPRARCHIYKKTNMRRKCRAAAAASASSAAAPAAPFQARHTPVPALGDWNV